ncbi:MAG: sulfatase [Pseudomonadota bacterium]
MKRIFAVGLVVLLLVGAFGYLNRKAIILSLVTNAERMVVEKNRPVAWDQGPKEPKTAVPGAPPNIIVILADDLGINDISTFGGGVANGRVPTPNIDRLAADGAIFANSYSGTGTCAPSRAMLMTGRYPSRTGFEFTPMPPGMGRIISMFSEDYLEEAGLPQMVYNAGGDTNRPHYIDMGLPPEEVTIAEILKASGYQTVHIGKWHLGRNGPFRAVRQGFDESLLMANGLYLPEDHPDAVNAKLEFDPIDRFLWARMQFAADFDNASEPLGEEYFEPARYLTDYWTDESLKVIEANRNRPFFLYLAHWGIHTPLQATREDYEAVGDIRPHRLRVYAAMVRALDRSVGRIMDKLEEEGLADNTIVVFSSDNGGAGYIGIPEVNTPYRGWKITLFEGGIRVPLFVKWPARIPAGTVIEEPVAHIDVLPTLTAAANATLPQDRVIDGQDLMALAEGETTSLERSDDALYWSSGFYKVVRAGDWKLHVNERQQKAWLFDLVNDPTEQTNLAETRPEKRVELEALIAAHWAQARAPLYPHSVETSICIDSTMAQPSCERGDYVIWPN